MSRLWRVAMRRVGLVIVSPTVGEIRRLGRCRWRMVAFPASVLAVHQLCYLLAYGSHAGAELSEHGDHYVVTAAVVAGALATISLGLGLLRLIAACRGRVQPTKSGVPLWLVWLGWT